jgi:hypothetical protein
VEKGNYVFCCGKGIANIVLRSVAKKSQTSRCPFVTEIKTKIKEAAEQIDRVHLHSEELQTLSSLDLSFLAFSLSLSL